MNIENDKEKELERLIQSYNFYKNENNDINNKEALYLVYNKYEKGLTIKENSYSKVIQKHDAIMFAENIRIDLFKLGAYVFTKIFDLKKFPVKIKNIPLRVLPNPDDDDEDEFEFEIDFENDLVIGLTLDTFYLWGQKHGKKGYIPLSNKVDENLLENHPYCTTSQYEYGDDEIDQQKLNEIIESLKPAADEMLSLIEDIAD